MPQSDATYGTMRARWPLIILVVGSVAAASLALGLLVVGPMIQRRMETPPPVLATSGTTALPPTQRAVTAADVQIKERIVRRPPPRPAPPKPDELSVELGPAPASGDAAAGLTDTQTRSTSGRPSIKATVTDASGTDGDAGSTPDLVTRERHRLPRQPEDASAPVAGDAGTAVGSGADVRPRSAPVPKAKSHRAAPLDALPVLDPNGPASNAATELPRAAPAASPDAQTPARSYRVQVGHFNDERDAETLRDELTQSGLSPRVVKTQKGGVTTYRVQVGTYNHKENADRQMEMLKSRSYDPYLAEDEP